MRRLCVTRSCSSSGTSTGDWSEIKLAGGWAALEYCGGGGAGWMQRVALLLLLLLLLLLVRQWQSCDILHDLAWCLLATDRRAHRSPTHTHTHTLTQVDYTRWTQYRTPHSPSSTHWAAATGRTSEQEQRVSCADCALLSLPLGCVRQIVVTTPTLGRLRSTAFWSVKTPMTCRPGQLYV